jgi:hypothetical protein
VEQSESGEEKPESKKDNSKNSEASLWPYFKLNL